MNHKNQDLELEPFCRIIMGEDNIKEVDLIAFKSEFTFYI